MFDLLTAIALICLLAGLSMVRIVAFASRVWIGLALASGAYGAAMIGMFLIRIGFDSQALRYVWAASFAVPAIAATVFLVPSAQDWLRAKWRQGGLKGISTR